MKQVFRKVLYSFLTSLFDRKKLIFLIGDRLDRILIGFENDGYLHDIGWTNSIKNNQIIGNTGQPLPWVTYPFIAFIETRLKPDLKLFEYGSGNSTLYYSAKVAEVHSVEDDLEWFNKVQQFRPSNSFLYLDEFTNGYSYCEYPLSLNIKFDVIVVDGKGRVDCCKLCLNALTEMGVVILDDSEREEYNEGIDFLLANDFKRLDFWGIAPAVTYSKCTTVFYKTGNCLQI